MEQIFIDYRAQVTESFPSIFSKEDVLALLDKLQDRVVDTHRILIEEVQQDNSAGLTFEQRQELEGNLRAAIERKIDRMDSSDVVDYDSAEFGIEYGNTLRLESVNFNSDTICDEIDDAISMVIGDFFQPIEEEDPIQVNDPQYAVTETPSN